MPDRIHELCAGLEAARQPYVLATVVRVMGSASAKPGSKAVIDAQGRNLFGWVGGGCAEGLVREESLKALAERQTRIVRVDLDDEVLGVGMPCGGNMEVYLEPRLPPRRLLICGDNRLTRHLAAVAGVLGYAVEVYGPRAAPEHFPSADRVQAGEWANLAPEAGSTVLIAGDHEDHGTVLRRVLAAQPGYVAMVASRKVAQGLLSALRRQGLPEAEVAAVRTPAGLDLCARTLEEISISVLSELLAWERNRDGRPLRRTTVADAQPEPRAAATDPPPPLVIVGHGRIAEELARLATLTGWPVTVNAVNAAAADFPPGACLITDDLDYARLDITPASFVVVATLHKGDHLSMQKALAGDAAYIGLIASRKRAGLILDFLREKNAPPDRMRRVFAPAGLNVGALNPTEIAFSILCEMVAVHRRGTALPLVELERLPSSGVADACRQLFQ